MSYKINKELFEEVMKVELAGFSINEENVIEYIVHQVGYFEICINTFFFDCKKWAYNQGYDMLSGGLEAGLHSCYIDYSDKRYTLSMKPINHFFADSEQHAVFDACQWILDNKDKQ